MRRECPSLMTDMRTIEDIHQEIERLSEERTELWHKLSAGQNPDVRAEIRALDARLDDLWPEQRALRAELRFGDREMDEIPVHDLGHPGR